MRIRTLAILGLGLSLLWAPACAEKPGKKKDDAADKGKKADPKAKDAKAKDAKAKDAKAKDAKADAKKDESPDPESEPD